MIAKYTRGMLYWCQLDRVTNITGEKTRPCVIVSNNIFNLFSGSVTVLPITSKGNKQKPQPTHVDINVTSDRDSVITCENIFTIPKYAVAQFIGILDDETMAKVDHCLKMALSFEEMPNEFVKYTQPEVELEGQTTGRESASKKPTKKILNRVYIHTSEQKHQFINDYETLDEEDVRLKYGIPTTTALRARYNYIKRTLDK